MSLEAYGEIAAVFSAFDTKETAISISPLGNGLINRTYKVITDSKDFVLQRVNTAIFKEPLKVMENIQRVTEHIRKNGGLSLTLIKSGDKYYFEDESGFYRLYEYVKDCVSHETVTPEIFENGAVELGKFVKYIGDLDASLIHETIKDFHNTRKRYEHFLETLKADRLSRAAECRDIIDYIIENRERAFAAVDALENKEIPLRVVHNDTKINNILFKENGEGLCVIDLDTVMPGSLLYDFGDAIRSGAANVPEYSPELDKVYLRLDLFGAFVRGYISGCDGALTEKEYEMLPISAFICTFEVMMRFTDDYLDGDVYFNPSVPGLNLLRARNQMILAKDILAKQDALADIVENEKQKIK